MNVLVWYNGVITRKPIVTKCITSLCTFGLSDFICQSIEKKSAAKKGKTKKYDFLRVFKQAFFGFAISPYFHLHFSKIIPTLFPIIPGASVNARVFKSLTYDQTIHAGLFTVIFYYYMGAFNGKNVEETTREVKIKFLPTMVDNWKLWPLAMFFNFKFIPPTYSVLYANLVGIVWLTYLSYLQNIKFAKI